MATTKTKAVKKAPAKKAVAKKTAAPRAKKEPVLEAGKNEAVVYSMTGAKAGTVALPAALFGAPWNADLVHQVVVGMQANARENSAHTKFRGEVRGGGKKPWKQKGTGRARHGSTRSPIWRKGGTTHGPRAERDYSVALPKKMRSAALASILSKKLRDGEIIFVDKLSFAKPATKEAKAALVALAKGADAARLVGKRKNAAVIAFAGKDAAAEKSFRNIGSVMTEEVRNLNALELVNATYLVIDNPSEAVKLLEARLTK